MKQILKAIYEKGVLKPLKKIKFPEHKELIVTIQDNDDLPSHLLTKAAEKSHSYLFLKKKGEDIYSLDDGKPIH
ncbi:MAG: hypothetical protein A3I11_07625 [Elusimicrobia bacterium RIFCSPLOWO2_02_FULL_39_32]|nr:MAG: hypothetical protein A2034_01260 [Elusimicrobia bacterium GWA2_38_7]OGR79749.1 MAG: hypothetical protein A3B80_01075 [Elusimicrobia bacterium RIFCSPHIGHO2_02_FULL_39_36]OGR92054.1 MAG: hypothetical protein A3I11_07625 [Elusimicrobia bacterium RIFCSPLOWO2_02_FULL_39_32]OGR98656.1 MAG: hypothetical protein A3G85_04805 [Elusimicrobia bacterium RIFCSPLOWO2_12_FULL_39_28]HLD79732.1 antitoxin family protein [Candidatus Nanoarchaeia archaeon]